MGRTPLAKARLAPAKTQVKSAFYRRTRKSKIVKHIALAICIILIPITAASAGEKAHMLEDSSLRTNPSPSGKIVGVLKKNELIEVLAPVGEWRKIERADGRVGFVEGRQLVEDSVVTTLSIALPLVLVLLVTIYVLVKKKSLRQKPNQKVDSDNKSLIPAEVGSELGTPQKRTEKIDVPSDPGERFYAKYGAPNIRTMDGHFVRSKAEKTIDDFLFSHSILHIYEAKIPAEIWAVCDFYLPKQNVYIEFWGMSDIDQYKNRMNFKQKIYESSSLNLVSLFPDDLRSLETSLNWQLERFRQ